MGFKINLKNALAIAAAPFTAGASLLLAEDTDNNTILDQITGAASAKKANEQNIALQRETNKMSIDLANTAHQREVADLEAAGLNPILSAGGSGAETPTLGTAEVQNTMPGGLMGQATQAAGILGTIAGAEQATSASGLQNAQALQTAVQTKYAPEIAKSEIAKNLAEAQNATSSSRYNDIMGQVNMMVGDANTEKALKEAALIEKDTKGRITMNAINTGANALNGVANVIGATKGMSFNPMTVNSAKTYNHQYGNSGFVLY